MNHTESNAAESPSTKPIPRGPSSGCLIGVISALVCLIVVVVISLIVGAKYHESIQHAYDKLGWSGEGHTTATSQPAEPQMYTCSMHPWILEPEPGNCPICSMTLIPVDTKNLTGQIAIDPVVVQNIGVRIEPIVEGPLERVIRTVGTIDYDETRLRDVNLKVSGWIDKLYVDQVGAAAEAGQPLFDIYSPELLEAQDNYLMHWRNRDKGNVGPLSEGSGSDESFLESTRDRLLNKDITEQQIRELEQRGTSSKTLAILSPHTGIVIDKHANEGMAVNPGMRVYRIADLSKVWVMVTLYEYQLPFVTVGQSAVMSLPYVPGQTFEGKVIYVYPYLDQATRQVKVRLEFDNPTGLLKPGMFTNIELHSRLAEQRTLAPRSAIIDTGAEQTAFVSLGEGKFESRTVQLGVETGDGTVEILDGLKVGEMVVTSGQFLLDSEAKMRDARAKMMAGRFAVDQKAVAAVEGRSELASMPEEMSAAVGAMLDDYFVIADTLADDSADGIAAPARRIAETVDALLAMTLEDQPHFWHEHEEAAVIRGKALELIDAAEMDQARLIFADLSIALSRLTKATGVPPEYPKPVEELHCPMYRSGQGGTTWLQPAGLVRNPYYGSVMLECFDTRKTMPVTGPEPSP